jgi:ribosomal subunit interface protein
MLKLNIKATNIKLDDFLYDYINEKIGGLDKFIEGIDSNAQAWVEVGKPSRHHKKGAEEFYAEVNIELSGRGKTIIRAEAGQWDLKMAIDEVKDKLQIELGKYKGKQEVKYKRNARIAKNLLRFSPTTWFNWAKRKKGKQNEKN